MVRGSGGTAVPAHLRRNRASHRPSAPSARSPHSLRPGQLDVLDGRPGDGARNDGRFPGKLRFTPPELTRIDAQLRTSRDQFAACGIPGVIIIAPNKQSLYGEFLINADAGSPPTRLDTLM